MADLAAYQQAAKDRDTKISITGDDYGVSTSDIMKWIEQGGIVAAGQYIVDIIKNLKSIGQFDTGGYTGSWGPEGKLAMLHEKEMVLNKDDT